MRGEEVDLIPAREKCLMIDCFLRVSVKTIQNFTATHLTGRWEKSIQAFYCGGLSYCEPRGEGIELFQSGRS